MDNTFTCTNTEFVDDNGQSELLVRHNKASDKRRKRRKNNIKHKRKDRQLYEIYKEYIISPISEKSNKKGKSYYQHIYYKNKYGKRCANKKVRRSDVIMNGGDYKKFYDYKWEIF